MTAYAVKRAALIVSPDHFLYDADGTYFWTPERTRSAWQTTEARTRSLLDGPGFTFLALLVGVPCSGKSHWLNASQAPSGLYLDATFFNRACRIPFFKIADEMKKPIQAVWMRTPLEVCIQRNRRRPPDRQVPEDKMSFFHSCLQEQPPTADPEFSTVEIVRPSGFL